MILTNAKRIRWDDREQHTLLQEVQRLVAERPHLTTLNAVQEAQKNVLPPERHRRIHTNAQVEWVQRRRAEWVRQLASAPQDSKPQEVQASPLDRAAGLIAEYLKEALQQVTSEVVERVRRHLEHVPPQPPTVASTQLKELRRTRIFVLGLMPTQEQEIRRMCSGCFEFRFLKNASPEKMRAAVDWADKAYVMTKFISHDDYYAIKGRADQIEHVNGAVSSLVESLRGLHERLQKPAHHGYPAAFGLYGIWEGFTDFLPLVPGL